VRKRIFFVMKKKSNFDLKVFQRYISESNQIRIQPSPVAREDPATHIVLIRI